MIVGFIGVGRMGGGLAKNILRAGKDILVYDLNDSAVQAVLDMGSTGKKVHNFQQFSDCDVIFTSLPLPEHVKGVMLGEQGVYAFMKAGSVHVELSTIDPGTAHTLASAAEERKISYLQSTLGKTPAHAEKAEEPMFIGGDDSVAKKLWSLFEIIGIPIYVGSIDASCAVKLVSNMIGMTTLAVLAEGIRTGERAGLDKKLMLELFADTGANSYQLNVRGPSIASEDFTAKFAVDLALKDVRLGLEMARDWGLDLKAMEIALDYFKKASASGLGQEDCSAVYKVIG